MIEGDEAEMLAATDAPVGETLLVREYLLLSNEANSTAQLPLTYSMANGYTEDELVTLIPQQKQPSPMANVGSTQLVPQANVSVQSLPYARPVTPQSFSRPHTASKALPQQCKS